MKRGNYRLESQFERARIMNITRDRKADGIEVRGMIDWLRAHSAELEDTSLFPDRDQRRGSEQVVTRTRERRPSSFRKNGRAVAAAVFSIRCPNGVTWTRPLIRFASGWTACGTPPGLDISVPECSLAKSLEGLICANTVKREMSSYV